MAVLAVATIALAVLGLMNAARFTRAARGACAVVAGSDYGRLFGVPNSAAGIAYYLVMIVLQGLWLWTRSLYLQLIALALALTALALGIYLVHALVRRLRTPCPLCMASHGINLAIVLVLLAGVLNR